MREIGVSLGSGREEESLKKWRGGELEGLTVSLFLFFFKIIYVFIFGCARPVFVAAQAFVC